ncbi:hypothetical protein B0H16DRAFT_1455366 [Mycena metata]|uniref:NB-ARC domain-containing protein n=1 Tax=Mycena metata TaxID=1033252 RepID=A0AAD7JGL4_9AGAR|nr:hypothetical protein B0H16DRAFT_1455366 [Mycena metata]
MPRTTTVAEKRLRNITDLLTTAVTLLSELDDAFGTPFLRPISKTTASLINLMQNCKRNKDQCVQLLEGLHGVLYAIIDLHLKSQTAGTLPPATLVHIGQFTETVHKIHTFVEAQQDGSKFRIFFRQGEMNSLLKACLSGLDTATRVFKIETGTMILNSIEDMRLRTADLHKELLEFISTHSDGILSDNSSSAIIATLSSEPSPRIAILGGGGMGKTTLVRAALHHPHISSTFEHRYFVAAESASTSTELAALIGLHIGLNSGTDLLRPVITMRGAERPAKVRWSRPFLQPLKPLSNAAARETFRDITDHLVEEEDMIQLLQLTDNMPLAVELVAHLTDYEEPSAILERWATEKTSSLAIGYDRRSNLDASIGMSLSSPRITPGPRSLLSLLSMLPDGPNTLLPPLKF